MNDRLFLGLAIGAVAAAVVGGWAIVGGPLQARQDNADKNRYQELDNLASLLLCKHSDHGPATPLPTQLSVDSLRAHCPDISIDSDALLDDETGEPYVYSRSNAAGFSVCASFYDSARTARLNHPLWYGGMSFNPETGCVLATLS